MLGSAADAVVTYRPACHAAGVRLRLGPACWVTRQRALLKAALAQRVCRSARHSGLWQRPRSAHPACHAQSWTEARGQVQEPGVNTVKKNMSKVRENKLLRKPLRDGVHIGFSQAAQAAQPTRTRLASCCQSYGKSWNKSGEMAKCRSTLSLHSQRQHVHLSRGCQAPLTKCS